MSRNLNDGRVCYVVLVAVVDSPGVLTQMKVEQRDFQYRLVSRALSSPLTNGGIELTFGRAVALFRELVADALATEPSSLGGEEVLDA